MNTIAIPPGYETGRHYHEEQEETYFIHRGTVEITFGDSATHVLGPGGIARVDAPTVRKLRNVGDGDALYFVVGGRGGYVGATAGCRRARHLHAGRAAAAVIAAVALATSAGSRPVPGAPDCSLFPKSGHWNQRVDDLPCCRVRTAWCVRSAPTTRCTPTSAPASTRARESGSVRDGGKSQPKVLCQVRLRRRVDPGPYPIPRHVPIEGGQLGRRPPRDRRRPCAAACMSSTRRIRTTEGTGGPAGLGRDLEPPLEQAAPSGGRRRTPPACRFCRRSRAGTVKRGRINHGDGSPRRRAARTSIERHFASDSNDPTFPRWDSGSG